MGDHSGKDRASRRAPAIYARYSRVYDAFTARTERPARTAGIELLAPREGERLLEIGSGPGRCLPAIGRAVGRSGRIYGVDLSPAMAALGSGRLRRAGLPGRGAALVADARRLPFGMGAFAGCLMVFTLELFPEMEIAGVLQECRRVLEPEGRLVLVGLSREPGGWVTRLYERGHRAAPRLLDCRPIDVAGTLEAAGFRVTAGRHMSLWGLGVAAVRGVN